MLGYTPRVWAWRPPSPVDRILDTRFWKYYLAQTSLRVVIIHLLGLSFIDAMIITFFLLLKCYKNHWEFNKSTRSYFDFPVYVLRIRKLWFWYFIKFNRLKAHSHWPSLTQRPILTPSNSVVSKSRSVWTLQYSFIQVIYFSVSMLNTVSVSANTPLHQGVKNHFGGSLT